MCRLTEEQRLKNKMRYFELLSKLNIDLTNLTKYLDMERVDYFNKPSNCYENGAYAGGLCSHALKLYDTLIELSNKYTPGKYTEEDIIKVALFKDLYKAELYESYLKNQKNEFGQWEQVQAYKNKDTRPVFGDISFGSYMIAKKFINLDNDELVEAICQSSFINNVDGHLIRSQYKLVTLVIIAELIIAHLN
jgi:hypothetical protein